MNKNIKKITNYSRLKGFKKIIGLIGRNKNETIIFKTRFGIHTFFLKYPIDLVIVNKKNKVVLIKKSIKPKRIVFWHPKYDTVIEMPEGKIEKLNLTIGSILKF